MGYGELDEAELQRRHAAGLPHPPHPAPLEEELARREPTEAERLWELHDRGFIDDAEYARELGKLGDRR
ncbi:hypothetical protein BH09ACT4_BH09ACT4_25480 [soil metagenome]